MPAVDPFLRFLAFDLALTREQAAASPRPSQLCDDLEAADELAGLERLPAEHRLDDVARVFRRSVVDAEARPDGVRACELVVGCVALARLTMTELAVAGEASERETHLAASVILEAERIVRRSA